MMKTSTDVAPLHEVEGCRWLALLTIARQAWLAEEHNNRGLAREFLGVLIRETRRDLERHERQKLRHRRERARLKAVP